MNFTTSGTMNQNPQFFFGESEGFYYHWFNYLVWESYRNNMWQIWYSKMFMGFSDINEATSDFVKSIAYPNPFTTSITIEYELDGKSKIQITIFNAIGEVVYQTEELSKVQGNHKVTWSPNHLPSGMYYAVLRSEEGVSVVKMLKQ